MTEIIKPQVDETKEPAPIELNILYRANGELLVTGCVNNDVLAYGLLHKAALAIEAHNKPKISSGNGFYKFVRGMK